MHDELNFGCSEEFAELCALSTSGTLSSEDEERLEAHVAVCAQCAPLLNQYRTIASSGMAALAATRDSESCPVEDLPDAAELKARVLAAVGHSGAARPTAIPKRARVWSRLLDAVRYPAVAVTAALVLLAVGAGYLAGASHRRGQVRSLLADAASGENSLTQELHDTRAELGTARQALSTAAERVSGLQAQLGALQTELDATQKSEKAIQDAKTAVEAKLQVSATEKQQQERIIASLGAERDSIGQKLHQSDVQLQAVREQLKAAQDEQRRFVLRAANLETEVDRLSGQLKEREEGLHSPEQLLTTDRDLREVMSARQLYIADVFDVDPQGKNRKSFGRVFYTRGKSLLFYAFDLDQQPRYKEPMAFQAWGQPGARNAVPISLGVFHLDNEKNRCWALRFENPKTLEAISEVFVTVEPHGGSRRPTSKPLLVAYLHSTTPNHP